MSTDELSSELSEIEAKINAMAWFESDRGESSQLGFYLLVTSIADEIGKVIEDLNKLRASRDSELSELFVTNK